MEFSSIQRSSRIDFSKFIAGRDGRKITATTTVIIILLWDFFTLVSSLRISISAPELVKQNDAFWLNCSYEKLNLKTAETNEEIYAIKWFKDNEEFYRYLPNSRPKVSTYPTNGIQLDVSRMKNMSS